MVAFIDQREAYAVESICATPSIAPATYYTHRAQAQGRSERLSVCARAYRGAGHGDH